MLLLLRSHSHNKNVCRHMSFVSTDINFIQRSVTMLTRISLSRRNLLSFMCFIINSSLITSANEYKNDVSVCACVYVCEYVQLTRLSHHLVNESER